MKPRERVVAAFKHIRPDRVPFFELGIDEGIAGKLLNRQISLYDRTFSFKHKLFEDYKEYGKINKEYVMEGIKNTCDLYSLLEMDIVPVRIYSSYISPLSFIYMGLTDSFENITLSKDILSEDSEVWKIENNEGFWSKLNFNKKNNTIYMQSDSISEGGISELKRFNKYAAKLLDASLKIFPEQIKIALDASRFALNYNKTSKMFVLGYGSLCFPTNATFHPLFLESMILNPDVAYDFLELTTEGVIPVIEEQLKIGVDGIICVNDYAYNSGPIFSPQHFKKFLVPFYKKIVDVCHKYGKPFIKHCDGDISSLLDMFIYDCGFDGIHAIEPSAGMDIYELKKKYGNKITLMGNLDCAELLVNGREEDLKKEIYKLINSLATEGGYIFSSSNSIHSGVSFENFKIMLDTFREVRDYE